MILHYHLFFCKEIYFFECLYFSEYDIRMPLYVFLVEKGVSIKYVSNWREIRGGSPKMRPAAYRGMGWHASCVRMNIWIFQIVIAENLSIIASSISAIYGITLFTRLFFLYSNFHKKQAFKCLFKFLLRREIENPTFYFLIFLVRIWSKTLF